MTPRFFKSQAVFRAWLEKHGASTKELWIGYYKKASGKGGLVYRQALDEALCFGWIDGVVHRIDDDCYMQRWTPRTRTSKWSLVNIKRMEELIKEGLVAEPGLKAYRERDPKRQTLYLYEQQDGPLASTGLLMVNPPWTLGGELKTILPELEKPLGQGGAARFRLETPKP